MGIEAAETRLSDVDCHGPYGLVMGNGAAFW
jgi:hypothetical protein